MDLSHLVKKIGHSLKEIRVRAMKSILSKLEHSLLSLSDLVQERMLFVVLLEWFNFPEVPMQDEVLELLSTLSKHPSAAQMLRDVGAVEFLTQLSPNVDPRLRAVIDGTLDQLFHLPDLLPSYTTVPPHSSGHGADTPPALPKDDSAKIGYFQKSRPGHTDAPPQRIAVCESVKCLKFSMFPWLPLTTTDRHILSSNESSLRSSDPTLVRTTCQLLRDVIMQDFPAEIFLQRPSIVQNLLSLLRLSSAEGEASHLGVQALGCLQQLCVGLRTRLRFHQDPGFSSAKLADTVSQNSSLSQSLDVRGTQPSRASSPASECSLRPSVLGRTGQRARGDGQDGDVASNSGSSHRGATAAAAGVQGSGQAAPSPGGAVPPLDLPVLGGEDVLELQLQQLSLAQFAVATLERAVPLLETESAHVLRRALELLSGAALLLADSVCELVWEDGSLVGAELREKLQSCLELLGDAVSYHHQGCQGGGPPGTLVHHTMAYTASAILTVRLLQAILPPEKAGEHLPERAAAAVLTLALDPALGGAFPGVQEAAVAYLEQVDPDGHALQRRVARAALWMESTCGFLKESQAQGDKNWLELLELAEHAIDGLPYHQHLSVIKECVQACAYLWGVDQPSPVLRSESQRLLLKLLSHPLPAVKTEAYTCVLHLVKECLGIQNASRPQCNGVHFLLHHKVLYEISAFGLQDSAEKVNSAATDVLLFLLKGRRMMTASTWDGFNAALHPVVPILQGYASTGDPLGQCVLLLSGGSDAAGAAPLPDPARLRAALRLLFTKQPTVRSAAVEHILPHLSGPGASEAARPELDQLTLASLPGLYCTQNLMDVSLDTCSKSFLKVESVEKLFGILTSDSVDLSLKRSATEQLAVVLQDTAMHPVLKALGIADTVVSFIMESVNGNKSMDGLLEPGLCVLRKLVFADPALRHSLSQRPPLLHVLLRASLIVKDNGGSGYEAAVLMCLLLFDEIATVDFWSGNSKLDGTLATFSLPLSVTRRFRIPFRAATHHAVSPHCCVVTPAADLLTFGPARHALQLAWNTAWYSGLDGLLDELRGFRSDVSEFHPSLVLSEAQVLNARTSHLPTGLLDCVQDIVMAAGHGSVRSALGRLRLYLLIDMLAFAHGQSHGCRKTLGSLSWQTAIARFLRVHPACVEDECLLVDIVAFLNVYFEHDPRTKDANETEDADLRWILELLLDKDTVSLCGFLLVGEGPAPGVPGQGPGGPAQGQGGAEELRGQVTQRLQREVSCFLSSLLHRLASTPDRICLALAGPFKSQLALCLLQSLRVSDAPRFYGLPSLERTLLGMVSLTALPGWSSQCPDLEPISLCSKYLVGLLEVISSFYVEWGGNSMSFMGKGVTKNAVICLQHLSHEMMAESRGEDFITQWSLGQEAGPEETNGPQLGLAWLIPLWVDRDPEVRFASLGVGRALSRRPGGCQALCGSCQNISGGLWGTLLNILLDQQESSLVRREAALILRNLLAMPMPANTEEAKDSLWKNPCVHDEASGVSLVGLPALQALLYHCQFFQHAALCAAACYRGRHAFHLQPPAPDGPPGPGPPGSTAGDSDDSLSFWRSSLLAAVNPSRASSSLSTSSTVVRGSGTHSPAPPGPLVAAADSAASRLVAQGQSDTDASSSLLSQDSRPPGEVSPAAEPVAMVTPDLVAAHCALLTRLLAALPDFTLAALRRQQLLKALAGLMDARSIERCLSELRTAAPPTGEQRAARSQVVTLLQYVSSYSKLLQSCVSASRELIGRMDFLRGLLTSLVAVLLLDTRDLDPVSQGAVALSWADVFSLLAVLVTRDPAALQTVSSALGRRWAAFEGTLAVCVNNSAVDPGLHTVALQFLCVLFSEETKRSGVRDDPGVTSDMSAALDGPGASDLCDLLLQSYEKSSPQDPMRRLTARALMSLLAYSRASQNHAAKAGLIDSCVEQMKQSQAQLHLQSIRPGKASQRRREEGCLREVRLAVEILRNALYRNDGCKEVAVDAHLPRALHALWAWLLLDDGVMEAALELLCVYTAGCSAACSSLCSAGSGGAPAGRGPPSGSLMHCVMKLASGVAADNSPVQKLAFSLLANLAMSRDCRGVLQKSNFLQSFLSVPVPRQGGGKAAAIGGGGGGLLAMWLRLLVCLSFGEDGQQSVLKVPGALEVLAGLAAHRPHALLTLHNLCSCPGNRPHLLSNDKAMKVLLSSLDSKETGVRSMGASALWALLHNSQKAKTSLKSPSVMLKLEKARAVAKKDAVKGPDSMNAYLLKCLENLCRLLKS
ncbi:rotatin [Gadus chalcogrammus]|uniref:rotatin n=1 Tax=Gadus chalcogrammus TaxID=1042646 RepID=UPI0024C4D5EE|nr:rotatin [Gadus chalcogrammus]